MIRTAIQRVAWGVLGLSLLAWAGSYDKTSPLPLPGDRALLLESGGVYLARGLRMYSVLGASRSVRVKPPLGSPPQYVKTGVVLPLWVPVQASLFVLWLAWRVGLERRAAALAGCCAACGYDLTGIDGRCPECGAEPFVSDESLDPVWM